MQRLDTHMVPCYKENSFLTKEAVMKKLFLVYSLVLSIFVFQGFAQLPEEKEAFADFEDGWLSGSLMLGSKLKIKDATRVTKVSETEYLYEVKISNSGKSDVFVQYTFLDKLITGCFSIPHIIPVKSGETKLFSLKTDLPPVTTYGEIRVFMWEEAKVSQRKQNDNMLFLGINAQFIYPDGKMLVSHFAGTRYGEVPEVVTECKN